MLISDIKGTHYSARALAYKGRPTPFRCLSFICLPLQFPFSTWRDVKLYQLPVVMLQTMLLQSWLGICRVKNPRPCCELYHRPTFTIRFGKQQRSESSLIIKYYRNLVFKNTRCPVKSDVYSNSLPLYGDTSLRLSTPTLRPPGESYSDYSRHLCDRFVASRVTTYT